MKKWLTSPPVVGSAVAIYGFGAVYDVFHYDTDHSAPVPINLQALSTGSLAPSVSFSAGWKNLTTDEYISPVPQSLIVTIR